MRSSFGLQGLKTESGGRQWDVLAFGDPVADIVVWAQQMPALGEKVLGRPVATLAGGTTANVGCALSRLGFRAAVYGRVGDDAHGQLLRASFTDFGVSQDFLHTGEGLHSATALTIVTASGEKAVVYMPIASAPLQEASLRAAIAQTRVVYAMPYDMAEFDMLSHIARGQYTLVAIDIEAAVAPDEKAMLERIRRADIVFFNESGFVAGTGETPSLGTMKKLLAYGPQAIVVTRGALGALAVDDRTAVAQAAFAANIVDTTGAGDTFNAAFLAAWLEGRKLDAALRFACAASSCTVAAMGARGGLPTRAAVDSIVAGSSSYALSIPS